MESSTGTTPPPEEPAGALDFEQSRRKEDFEEEPSHYVGIGASAGGLEAIELFFKHMPEDSGMAFVVVQHLSPDYKSLMVELLSKRTGMRVLRALEGTRAAPNEVYLIPPKKNLRIFHGKLLLDDQDFSKGINLPIDIFLRSLAEDQGEKAVGIILSGTGSDGMRGIRSIKESGGMVMVQDEESAKFDGMPKSAISTGLADFILPPQDMPKQLLAFAKHPYVKKTERSDTILTDEDRMSRIFSLLRDKTKVDFTFYKPSTVVRRIERRMTVNQIHELKDYVRFLEMNHREIHTLYRELLIGVTSFFRDREAFRLLDEKFLPKLIENCNNNLRFWITGCSTGEEAYTIAILSRECMNRMNKELDIKIFATDIDRDAIFRASGGEYPESIAADLSPELLGRYFYKKEDVFQVSRSLREMVVFARHDLIKDPPFTNIDLVSCRNLLIYLQPVLQKKVLEQFNFSLKPDGILLLGTSETTGDMAPFFEAQDHRWKIYRCRGKRKPVVDPMEIPTHRFEHSGLLEKQSYRHGMYRQHEEERILDRFLQSLSPEYVPLSMVVNEEMEVVYVLGDTGGFFRLPTGKIVNNISKMAAKDLSIPLNTGIQKVLKTGEGLTYSNINVNVGNEPKRINLQIKPLHRKKGQNLLTAVFIEEVSQSRKIATKTGESYSYDVDREAQQRILDLEQELQFTRENLQATIEELETSNEELQATNEELLASNEELQSTNEELQSVNEELYTVNAEYQSKIIELTELNNDMDNLLSSTKIATLFLDEYLEIRKFTPGVGKIYKIMESDIGRPIGHLSHEFEDADPLDTIKWVGRNSEPVEAEMRTRKGAWYLMRVLPYFIAPEVVSGVVVTFVEINKLKTSQEALRRERDIVNQIMETSPMGITMVSADGRIEFANSRAEEVLGLTKDEISQRSYNSPHWKITDFNGNPFPEDRLPVRRVMDTRTPVFNVRHAIERNGGEKVFLSINSAPLLGGDGEIIGIVSTIENLTEDYLFQEKMEKSEQSYRELFGAMHFGVVIYEPVNDGQDFVIKEINSEALTIEKIGREDVVGKRLTEVFPGVREFGLLDLLRDVYENGGCRVLPFSLYRDHRTCGWRKNHVCKLSEQTLVVVYCDEEKVCRLEQARLRNRENMRCLIEGFPVPSLLLDPDGKIRFVNEIARIALERSGKNANNENIFDVLGTQNAERRKKELRTAIEEGVPVVLPSSDRGSFFPEFIYPILDKDDKVEFVIWAGAPIES